MSGSTVYSGAFPAVEPVATYRLQVKKLWADDWTTRPDLELVSAKTEAGSVGVGGLEFAARYGTIKHPWETAFSDHEPDDFQDWFIRLVLDDGADGVVNWIGQVGNSGERTHGSGAGKAGQQNWQAYGPAQILRKIPVSTSRWKPASGTTPLTLGWTPAFNRRDKTGAIVGNRSSSTYGGFPSYVFGGTSTWNRVQMATYLINQLVNGTARPEWTLYFQTPTLQTAIEQMQDIMDMRGVNNAAAALNHIFPTKLGLDWLVVPGQQTVGGDTDAGDFAIFVFPLGSKEIEMDGIHIPANSETWNVDMSDPFVDSVTTAQAREHVYDRILVHGQRIVIASSLDFDSLSLGSAWTNDLETDYKAGTGGVDDSGEEHDKARSNERYKPVYQHLAVPSTWARNYRRPKCKRDGNVSDVAGMLEDGDYQTTVRETLSWLPFREGWDYSGATPVDENATDAEAELVRPLAWVWDEDTSQYVACEKVGISVSVPLHELGINLNATPNHLLALNHWTGSPKDTDTEPKYDYDRTVATIAWRTDQRLEAWYDVYDVSKTGATLEIEVTGAELWIAAPNTAYGTDTTAGALKRIGHPGGKTYQIIRDDSAMIRVVLAGAVARYQATRNRAEVVYHGIVAIPVGSLLTTVSGGLGRGESDETIQTPVTSYEIICGDSIRSIVRCGYAE